MVRNHEDWLDPVMLTERGHQRVVEAVVCVQNRGVALVREHANQLPRNGRHRDIRHWYQYGILGIHAHDCQDVLIATRSGRERSQRVKATRAQGASTLTLRAGTEIRFAGVNKAHSGHSLRTRMATSSMPDHFMDQFRRQNWTMRYASIWTMKRRWTHSMMAVASESLRGAGGARSKWPTHSSLDSAGWRRCLATKRRCGRDTVRYVGRR